LRGKKAILQVKRHVEKRGGGGTRYSCIIIHALLRRHQLVIKRRYDRLTHRLGTDLSIIPYKEIERLTAREYSKCAYIWICRCVHEEKPVTVDKLFKRVTRRTSLSPSRNSKRGPFPNKLVCIGCWLSPSNVTYVLSRVLILLNPITNNFGFRNNR